MNGIGERTDELLDLGELVMTEENEQETEASTRSGSVMTRTPMKGTHQN